MTMKQLAAAVAATTLTIAGAAFAQTSQTPAATPDNTGSTVSTPPATMPAEVVPPSITDATAPATEVIATPPRAEWVMPTRTEVATEAASMNRADQIPDGELSTKYQDKGHAVGSRPF